MLGIQWLFMHGCGECLALLAYSYKPKALLDIMTFVIWDIRVYAHLSRNAKDAYIFYMYGSLL